MQIQFFYSTSHLTQLLHHVLMLFITPLFPFINVIIIISNSIHTFYLIYFFLFHILLTFLLPFIHTFYSPHLFTHSLVHPPTSEFWQCFWRVFFFFASTLPLSIIPCDIPWCSRKAWANRATRSHASDQHTLFSLIAPRWQQQHVDSIWKQKTQDSHWWLADFSIWWHFIEFYGPPFPSLEAEKICFDDKSCQWLFTS